MVMYRPPMVWNMDELCVSPQVLQVVIGTNFWQEDMDEHVHEIHRYPLVVAESGHVDRLFAEVLAAHVAHRFCDSFHLGRGSALADNEVFGDGAIHFTEVGDYDILTFFLLYTFFNSLYELFNCVH